MRVGVIQTQVPFVMGGAERHSANLCAALRRHGHEVAEITLPFQWYPPETLVDSILAAKLIDLSEVEGVATDLAIGLRFPAYLAQHPNKVFWIIHQYRQAYDQWDTGESDLLTHPQGETIRHLVRTEDKAAFAQTSRPIYANSKTVADRLQGYLNQKSVPLYHPPAKAELFRQGDFGDYIFAPGRLNSSKRPELLLEALALTRPPLKLVIAGVAENPGYMAKLSSLADKLGVSDRVTWLGGITDAAMREAYAQARAVAFVPRNEDYGYITLEAMLAGKPVITTQDSGGPLEFIRHNREGLVVLPNARQLAECFEQAMQDRHGAERMGQAGHKRYHGLNINWDTVVETLTGKPRPKDSLRPEAEADQASWFGSVSASLVSKSAGRTQETAQDQAVRELKAAVAPVAPGPSTGPFGSIREVLSAYDFDTLPRPAEEGPPELDSGLADYLETHWTRFLTTLELVAARQPQRVLDVGVFPPFAFEAMLVNALPGVEIGGVWEGPTGYHQEIRSHAGDYPGFEITLRPANIERDAIPYADATFDLVLGMEILEHLALDPYFFLCQANRVLRPGGHVLLSTPNVASHRGVWKVLNGEAPYSFGIFVPTGGVYGRHNREYAPAEVVHLAQAAGFETETLKTVDVYDDKVDPAIAELLRQRGDDFSMRGETIFYVGRKVAAPGGAPERLYHGDPERMSGRLSITEREDATGLIRILVENLSPAWWPVTSGFATKLLAEWIDADGVMRHTNILLPLPDAIGPGQSRSIALRLDPESAQDEDVSKARGVLSLSLFQSGVGNLAGTGRANIVRVPCTEAAFVRLALGGD